MDIIQRAKNIHSLIAQDVYPNGQDMTCREGCGYAFHATAEDCASYLAHGWPRHCGREMISKDPKEE